MGEADLLKSNGVLAADVVKLPDGANLMRDSGLKALITGVLMERDMARYAEIFRVAARLPEATPWMKLACVNEVINGLRRDPESTMLELRAWAKAEYAAAKLGDSASTPNMQDLLGKQCDNIALTERALGLYYEASLTHRESAMHFLAAGNLEGVRVALFYSANEGASDAIIEGDAKRAEDAIDHMVAMEELICCSTEPYPQRMQESAKLHIVFAKMKWACRRETEFCLLENVSGEELGAAYEACDGTSGVDVPHFKMLLDMAENFDGKDYESVINLGEEAEEKWGNAKGSGVREALLFMKVLRALACYQRWSAVSAVELLKEVVKYDGPDGGMPIAVAMRCLFDLFSCRVRGTCNIEEEVE